MKATIRSALALATLLVLGGLPAAAQEYASPVGTWDLLVSGSGQQGIAFFTFYPALTNRNQGTFSGYQLVSQKQKTTSSNDGGRNVGGDVGRYITIDTNNPTPGGTNLLGFTPVSGPWWYDEKGRVVGYFTIAGGFHEPVTNVIVTPGYTNAIGEEVLPSTRVEVDYGGFTNAFSYEAKVVTGKRLTLACSTSSGKVTYKGVPYKTVPSIGGRWSGVKQENHQDFLQDFDLTSFAIGNPFTNSYSDDITNYANIYFSTNGTGPGYEFDAAAMVSTRKKIGFTFYTFPEGSTNVYDTKLGVTFGPFIRNNRVTKANTTGFEAPEPGEALSVPVKFQGALQRGL